MFGGTFAAGLLLCAIPAYEARLPAELRAAGPVVFSALVGLGMVLGELPNSFLKRQLDIAPGTQRRTLLGVLVSVLDQGDFVLGVFVCLLPVWVMPAPALLASFVVVATGHLAVSGVGYAVGARRSWL